MCITGKFSSLAAAFKKIEYIHTYTQIYMYIYITTTGKFNGLADAFKKIDKDDSGTVSKEVRINVFRRNVYIHTHTHRHVFKGVFRRHHDPGAHL
jgi:hypothetical protein